MLGVIRLQLDAGELGDAVDQFADFGTGQPLDLLERGRSIFSTVSCKSPVATEAVSSFISVRMPATPRG